MAEPLLIALAVSNAAFALLVGLAYGRTIQRWASVCYEAISTLVSSQLILGLYALVLIYILLSLRSLKDDVAQVAQATTRPTRRKHTRPQPVYDANDRLIGYFRGDRKSDITFRNIGRATTDSVLDGAASAPTSPESRPAPAAVSPPSPIIFQPPQVHVYRSLQASEWNGWPDGHLRCQIQRQELKETGNLALFWVSEAIAGRRPGSPDALKPEGGKQFRVNCLGAFRCSARFAARRLAALMPSPSPPFLPAVTALDIPHCDVSVDIPLPNAHVVSRWALPSSDTALSSHITALTVTTVTATLAGCSQYRERRLAWSN